MAVAPGARFASCSMTTGTISILMSVTLIPGVIIVRVPLIIPVINFGPEVHFLDVEKGIIVVYFIQLSPACPHELAGKCYLSF